MYQTLCRLPIVHSKKLGASTLAFRGSLLWNTLSNEIKGLNSIRKFRKEIRLVDATNGTCHICTNSLFVLFNCFYYIYTYSFVLNCRGVRISRGVDIFLNFSKVGGS